MEPGGEKVASKTRSCIGGLALLALALPAVAATELVVNGGFDTDGSGWVYNNLGTDGGWQAGRGNPPGAFWINHNGGPVGGDPDPMLSQSITTSAGASYSLTFDVVQYVINSGAPAFAVDIDGVEQASFTLGPTWASHTLDFTAASSSTRLSFRAEINGTDNDALLDNVSVMVVPEPRTYALFGAGLLALAGLVSRRRAVEFGRARASGRST